MGKTCCACGGTGGGPGKEKIAFHKFPLLDNVRLKAWIKNMDKGNFSPNNRSYLCSLHFEPHCFWKSRKNRALSDDAIPTIFNLNLKKKKSKRRHTVFSKNVPSSTTKQMEVDVNLNKRGTNSNDTVNNNTKINPLFESQQVNKIFDFKNINKRIEQLNEIYKNDIENMVVIKRENELMDLNVIKNRINELKTNTDSNQKPSVNEKYGVQLKPNKATELNKNIPSKEKSPIKLVAKKCSQFFRHDHTYTKDILNEKNILGNSSNRALFDGFNDNISDEEVMKRITEMGKSNTVILIPQDIPIKRKAERDESHAECLKTNDAKNSDRPMPVLDSKQQTVDLEDVGVNAISNNESNYKKDSNSLSDVESESEIGEFKSNEVKVSGKIGKSNEEVFKLLLNRNVKLSEDLQRIIDSQKTAMDGQKRNDPLCGEGVPDNTVLPVYDFGLILYSISPEAFKFVGMYTDLELPDLTTVKTAPKLSDIEKEIILADV